ncbi:DUF424 domain-containing protein [Methanohalophilus sp. WG1-DM]|jgi:hypothetical protein|uniref:DUF424 domain-containing protein n=1 Tax=Methanohalophilus sp. WG1-DM TaxID=2491675 RepID=UPI000FFE499A|nr:DUF424 family protein [Methanohalophilus sp. WG1-DM]RXG34218.1 hypothetical protein CI957_1126 [Methanohalophilus sp. WG1-DM]
MYLKEHRTRDRLIVAACDQELIGQKLNQGDVVVEITESFYKGDIVSEKQVQSALGRATSANLFGKKTIECALECRMIDPESIITINGVPHAQLYRI